MIALTLALALQASTPALDAEARERNCADPQNQQDMNVCANIDFQRADLELNQVWARVMAEAQRRDGERSAMERQSDTRPGNAVVLRAAQRAWLVYREQNCTYAGMDEARGGSMENMVYDGCRTQVTRARIRELTGQHEPEQ
jgi:uncharacterized protein YecT (DUF1311 family)